MVKLGNLLKKSRLEKKMTLEDVASSCGYSKALISRIENDNVAPSIESLTKISSVLGLSLYDIFASLPIEQQVILRRDERDKIKIPDGDFEMEYLVPDPSNVSMLPVLYSGEEGAHSTDRMALHVGQEWTFITKGRVELTVGQKKYILNEGDSVYFNSGIPHQYVCLSKGTSQGIAINIPPFRY